MAFERGIDTVIFDFDGTIMDTNKVIMLSWQHTFNTIKGRDGDVDYILHTYGEPLELSMRNTFPEVPTEEAVQIYRDYHRANFWHLIELFPGAKEMVAKVKEMGYKTGLATSRVQKTTMQGLEKFDIKKYFDVIVTVEDVTKHKPDPESVLVTLDKLGSIPENTVMMGDTRFDILCARNAGVTSILVGWSEALAGKKIEDFAPGEAPDYIIQKPEELFDII